MDGDERIVRVGGQALPDGVLMRTNRVWAIARRDGSVETGELPQSCLARVPIVRVVAGLGPALLLGLRGGRSRSEQRRVPWPMLRGLVLAQAAVVCGDWWAGHYHLDHAWAPCLAFVALMVAIVVFRVATPGAQWRYHGAEHKAVAAHELGIDLENLDDVLACSRVHPRCGTNLIVWVTLAAVWFSRLPLLPQLGGTIFAFAVVAEVMTFAARYPGAWPTKTLQAPGGLLQRLVTTSEPTLGEQFVACRALSACLARHAAAPGYVLAAARD